MSTDYTDIHRFFIGICVICVICGSLLAQSPPPKRKPIKDFGSSLRKNAAGVKANQQALDEGDVIYTYTALVHCELLVLDERGNSVPGLTDEDFLITEDGENQPVAHFVKGDNVSVPRTIVLIIDYSGSQLPYLKNSIKAAKVLVDKLGPKDVMAIVTDDVELLLDFTSDKKKLKKELDSLVERTRFHPGFIGAIRDKPRIGLSKQYSALMATLNETFSSEDIRPIVIFQTDGDEAYFLQNPVITLTVPDGLDGTALANAQRSVEFHQRERRKDPPQFSLDDLYHEVEKSRATLYTVVPGIKLLGLTPEEQFEKMRAEQLAQLAELMRGKSSDERARLKDRYKEDRNSQITMRWMAERVAKLQSALAGVASLTGGWTEFLETPEQADAIYARIFSDINQRYVVGYYPSNKARDGARRKIDFQVKGHPEYQIYGRRSYFAPLP